MKKPSPLANFLGTGLAHLQHVTDRAVEWGFARMKELNDQPAPAKPKAKKKGAANVADHAARFGRQVIGFIGEAGDTYYKKYEDLKRGGKKRGSE